MQYYRNLKQIVIDQPYMLPNGLVDISESEKTVAAVDVIVDSKIEAICLSGEIGWRIKPFTTGGSQGRLELKIKRNGQVIYKKLDDLFLIDGFSCARRTTGVTCFDLKPLEGQVKYELIISGTSENVDVFRVTGPLTFVSTAYSLLI